MSEADHPIRVLVVDDDALDRETVRRALQEMTPTVEIAEASSVADAEAFLERARFDCVVLDYLLPEGPSIDFIDRLRGGAPRAAVVVLTGQGDEAIAVELMKAGVADYLRKDALDAGRLRRAVKFAVALHHAQSVAARATATRDRHASQLTRFVESAPAIVASRSMDALAQTTCEVALAVLEAAESFLSIGSGDQQVVVREPRESGAELQTWASELFSGDGLSSATVRAGERAACPLLSWKGRCRGVLAVRLPPAPPGDQGTQEQLLCQLGVLASVSADNLSLYEAAARAVRARDDIMAVVSHDLRTPLNNIRLGASLLRDNMDDSGRAIVERVDRNVSMMARLVDDLVDMVRIEGGAIELRSHREPVEELLHAASDLIAAQVSTAEQRLEITAPSGLYVRADRERLLQVLANLLGNAVKFSPRGGRILLAAEEHGGSVRFEVRDSGRGIGSDEGDKIFARFWQSDPKKRRGLGLGLYIAKGLVQAHGGLLWYESQEGEGTRFFFTLPQEAPATRATTRV